jgi:hypothetical protein
MKKSDIIEKVKRESHLRADGGTRALASAIASYYHYEIPEYVVSKMLTAINTKNRYIRSHKDKDLRIADIKQQGGRGRENVNQMSFDF